MRIISGKFGGRRVNSKIPTGIRPTTDQTRESIFNLLDNLIDIQGIRALDVCAGSGMLGFEALSRGAKRCDFIEKNRKAASFIWHIAKSFDIKKEAYDVIVGDAKKITFKLNEYLEDEVGLIFFDPPYEAALYDEVLHNLSMSDLVAKDAIFISERSSLKQFKYPEAFELIKSKNYGGACVDVLIKK